jgi:hypothetical protein
MDGYGWVGFPRDNDPPRTKQTTLVMPRVVQLLWCSSALLLLGFVPRSFVEATAPGHPRCAHSEDASYDDARKANALLEMHTGKNHHGT